MGSDLALIRIPKGNKRFYIFQFLWGAINALLNSRMSKMRRNFS
jgi:hypothetical protein